jgi:hypothetical protein
MGAQEAVALVGHERDERRDDDCQVIERGVPFERGQLVADGFAGAGG